MNNIKKKIKYTIYYIIGQNNLKKNKQKKKIIKNIKNIYKNINIYNYFINKNFTWNVITNEIINTNVYFKNPKIIILNINKYINKLNDLIKKYILNIFKKQKIYLIFNYEFKQNINLIKTHKKYKILNCKLKTKKFNNNNNNKYIKKLITYIFNKKNIKKFFITFNKIKYKNFDKIFIFNILFNNFILNINKNIYIYTKKIIDIFYKYEINYKFNNKITWNNIEILCLYIIKYNSLKF